MIQKLLKKDLIIYILIFIALLLLINKDYQLYFWLWWQWVLLLIPITWTLILVNTFRNASAKSPHAESDLRCFRGMRYFFQIFGILHLLVFECVFIIWQTEYYNYWNLDIYDYYYMRKRNLSRIICIPIIILAYVCMLSYSCAMLEACWDLERQNRSIQSQENNRVQQQQCVMLVQDFRPVQPQPNVIVYPAQMQVQPYAHMQQAYFAQPVMPHSFDANLAPNNIEVHAVSVQDV